MSSSAAPFMEMDEGDGIIGGKKECMKAKCGSSRASAIC